MDVKSVSGKNIWVFWRGYFIATCGSLLILFIFKFIGHRYFLKLINYDTGGGFNDLLKESLLCCPPVLVIVLFQLIILFTFILFNRRNIEISGSRMWIFFALELFLAFVPLLIILGLFYSNASFF
jgi:hypothetical protein